MQALKQASTPRAYPPPIASNLRLGARQPLRAKAELSRVRDVAEVSTLASELMAGTSHDNVSEGAIRPVVGTVLEQWLDGAHKEQAQFSSVALYMEFKLRRVLQATAGLPTPNEFRTAAACECFDQLTDQLGRFGSLLQMLKKELLVAVYVDFVPVRVAV